MRLDNTTLDNLRHCLFFVAIYPPMPILTVLIGTKSKSKFVLVPLVPMVLVTILALPICLLGFIDSADRALSTKQLKVLNVGTHHVEFWLEDRPNFKSVPRILIEEGVPLFCGLHRMKSLDFIYDQSTVDPKVIDKHSLSYNVEALNRYHETDPRMDRSKDHFYIYDFDSETHTRRLE
jgi:hypothetical protein